MHTALKIELCSDRRLPNSPVKDRNLKCIIISVASNTQIQPVEALGIRYPQIICRSHVFGVSASFDPLVIVDILSVIFWSSIIEREEQPCFALDVIQDNCNLLLARGQGILEVLV